MKLLNNSIASAILLKSQSIEDFWKISHVLKSSRWITGSLPEDELRNLRFEEVENRVREVLVVGVGSGATANHLESMGYSVSVLDISEVALRQVRPNIAKFSAKDYQKLPKDTFDLVLHHLVAQHMTSVDLIHQLKVLYNSLRNGGEIRVQIASSLVVERNDLEETFMDLKRGSILRSEQAIINIARIVTSDFEVRHLYDFPLWEEGWRWYLLVLKKKK